MPAAKKKEFKHTDNSDKTIPKVLSHANDPFVLKKVEEAGETLRNTDLSILTNKSPDFQPEKG